MTNDRWHRLFDAMAHVAPAADVLSPAAIRDRFGDRHAWQVRVGQVWRATGDGVTALVYLTDVADGVVVAAPVTLGTTTGSAGCAILQTTQTVFADPLAVWLPNARRLGWGALDGILDTWSAPVVAWIASDGSGDPPPGCRLQTQDAPLLSSAWDQFSEASADLHELALQFPATPPLNPETAEGQSLEKLRPSDIARWLGITVTEAQNLRRGYTQASPEQLAIIERESGQPVSSASTVPYEVFADASHPMYRDDVAALSARRGTSVPDTQRRLARDAYALAARRSGGEGGRWRAQIDAVISSELTGRREDP